MFFRKKLKKQKEEQRTTLIIEEMVTDNNGLPILNFGDDVEAFKKAQAQHLNNRKKSAKNCSANYSKYFIDDID